MYKIAKKHAKEFLGWLEKQKVDPKDPRQLPELLEEKLTEVIDEAMLECVGRLLDDALTKGRLNR